jgi:hypothetical protein
MDIYKVGTSRWPHASYTGPLASTAVRPVLNPPAIDFDPRPPRNAKMTEARVVKLVDTRDLKSLGCEGGHAGSSPALGTIRNETWEHPVDAAERRCQPADVITPKGGFVLKTLSCLLLAAILTGCLPIGIRGTSLPNYADTTRGPDVDARAIRHVV